MNYAFGAAGAAGASSAGGAGASSAGGAGASSAGGAGASTGSAGTAAAGTPSDAGAVTPQLPSAQPEEAAAPQELQLELAEPHELQPVLQLEQLGAADAHELQPVSQLEQLGAGAHELQPVSQLEQLGAGAHELQPVSQLEQLGAGAHVLSQDDWQHDGAGWQHVTRTRLHRFTRPQRRPASAAGAIAITAAMANMKKCRIKSSFFLFGGTSDSWISNKLMLKSSRQPSYRRLVSS